MKDLQFGYKVIADFTAQADFVILDKGAGKYDRYIAAHYPKLDDDGNLRCWGQGHYCSNLAEALDVVQEWLEEEDEEDILDGDLEDVLDSLLDDYASNMPCDNSGYCAGTSCSRYFQCHS